MPAMPSLKMTSMPMSLTSPARTCSLRIGSERSGNGVPSYLDELIPTAERGVPAISVIDGHPLTLGWLGRRLGCPLIPLGVVSFGESGSIQALYHKHHIDVEAILGRYRTAAGGKTLKAVGA